jgi:hypothetical protein
MLKKILIGLAVLVVLIVGYAAMLPSAFKIERSATINAPAENIFPHINSLKNFTAWNPWGKIDPKATENFEGPIEGVGSAYSWNGNMDVGAGKMTIVESQPSSLIKMRLDFIKPFAGTNMADFTLQPAAGGTVVTWTMTGDAPLFNRIMCLFMNMDKMVGGQFEKGLASLKTIAESEKTN